MQTLREHYSAKARRCGYWATARELAKLGYSVEVALYLVGLRPRPYRRYWQ